MRIILIYLVEVIIMTIHNCAMLLKNYPLE